VHCVLKFFVAFFKNSTIHFSFCMFFPFCLFLYAYFVLVTSPITSILWLTCSLHAYILICLLIVCMFIACLHHLFVTYMHHLFTYMLRVKIPTKLVICSSLASLFIASFHVVLPPYLYVQVLKRKAGRPTIV